MEENLELAELLEDEDRPIIIRRSLRPAVDLDITPMIDITFLLLIFFLVASTLGAKTAIDLPPARHGSGVSMRTSTIISVVEGDTPTMARVYLGDGTSGDPLPDDKDQQDRAIAAAVAAGLGDGKSTVLVKAAKGVLHREVARVAEAAAQIDGIELHLAVFETE